MKKIDSFNLKPRRQRLKALALVLPLVFVAAMMLMVVPARASTEATVTLPTNVHTATPLVWQPCSDVPSRDCATLTVPLDYTNQTGSTISLPVSRQRATDSAHRIGTLILNTGGPGNAMAGIVRYNNLSNRLDPTVLARFDVVGLDPRGTTEGITCNTTADLTTYWNTNRLPQTDAQRQVLLNQEIAFNQGCVNRNQPLASHIDSASSIRDMELLRQAMALTGDATASQLTLLGYSYGTFIMQRYAALYPQHVRALFMDSVENHKALDEQSITESHIAFEHSWSVFKRWCQATADCALHGQDLDQIFDQAIARARIGTGIPAPHGPITQKPVNDWVLTLALEATTAAGQENFAWTADILAKAVAGPAEDASLARYLYDALTGSNFDGNYDPTGAGTHRAIACLDRTFSQWLDTPTKVKAFETVTKGVAPRYGIDSLYQGAIQCYKYPVAPVEAAPLNSPVPATVPALVVSASEDAATPLIWAQRALSEMANGRLVIRNGDGHISYRFSACVRSYATAYLLTLQRPANGTHCASDPVDVIPPPDLGIAPAVHSAGSISTVDQMLQRLK
ncbi:MAG TPA: alpha/beta hydrolase [Methylomirabilota bacterium]|nr:alpha/beta hydrolase [Methylomirabilota bacterium]